jgi:hypothetical protein
MTWIRTKEIPPGSGNHYKYKLESYRTENGDVRQKQEYIGPADQPYEPENKSSQTEKDHQESELSEKERKKVISKLTKKGVIVGREAADIIKFRDVEIIESLETKPMYVSKNMVNVLRNQNKDEEIEITTEKAESSSNQSYQEIKSISDIPEFLGVDGESYGPYTEGDKAEVPVENADILVNRGAAERIGSREKSGTNNSSDNEKQEEQESEEETGNSEDDWMTEEEENILELLPEDEGVKEEKIREKQDWNNFDKSVKRLKTYGKAFEPAPRKIQKI